MPKAKNNSKYIWVFPVSQNNWFWISLANAIYSKIGLMPLLIVPTKQDKDFYLSKYGDNIGEKQIVVATSQYDEAIDTNIDEYEFLSKQVRNLEDRFNMTANRSLIQADRHLGKGYIWGWHGHPRSIVSENAGPAGRLKAVLTRFDFFCDLFDSHPPGLVIGASGLGSGVATGPVWHLCNKWEVPFRTLAPARFGALYYWAVDPFDNPPTDFITKFNKRLKISKTDRKTFQSLMKPPATFTAVQRKSPYRSFRAAVKISFRQFAMRLFHKMKGYSKSRYGYKLIDSTIAPFLEWRNGLYLKQLGLTRLNEIPKHLKVVVLPLQFEPEISLQGQSPDASNILSVIYETSLSLPSDTSLIVKEHPIQVGRRPHWFYDCIKKLPNTVLLDPMTSSADVLSKASAVVQINSSMGYEAAARGIPIFAFSKHGTLPALDHVSIVHSVDDLANLQSLAGSNNSSAVIKKRRNDGVNFVLALHEYCTDLSWLYNKNKGTEVPKKQLEAIVGRLTETMKSNDGHQE